ncbi:MAG: 4-hydroxythreonine-4-phosphate dehydrogenase PdxA [Deltaproteobacteria bacterium]|nr:4-hydroxythreonine-4-phosphate dehydrogenase PdxA [Deltaproteobacteria bacterium]
MNKKNLHIIAVTMGDPTGIGPEIILKAAQEESIYKKCRPLVIGDADIIEGTKKIVSSGIKINPIKDPAQGKYQFGTMDIIHLSELIYEKTVYGKPNNKTSNAMVKYIVEAIKLTMQKKVDGVATCPINKEAMNFAGYNYNGHTEIFAEKTKTKDYVMMFYGDKLKTALVTIHVPLKDVPFLITKNKIEKTIRITGKALIERFGIKKPKIAIAAFNPHSGENNMFGDEEERIIIPGIKAAESKQYKLFGPISGDTVFYRAIKKEYDAVISIYHDQGLIPFKMIHFQDGVNTTLGLPIIRTSVAHGTAYDIAGKGKANHRSLLAAIKLAALQSRDVA